MVPVFILQQIPVRIGYIQQITVFVFHLVFGKCTIFLCTVDGNCGSGNFFSTCHIHFCQEYLNRFVCHGNGLHTFLRTHIKDWYINRCCHCIAVRSLLFYQHIFPHRKILKTHGSCLRDIANRLTCSRNLLYLIIIGRVAVSTRYGNLMGRFSHITSIICLPFIHLLFLMIEYGSIISILHFPILIYLGFV